MKEHHRSTVTITGITHPDQPRTDANVYLDHRHRTDDNQATASSYVAQTSS
jgi:hypothetical protein